MLVGVPTVGEIIMSGQMNVDENGGDDRKDDGKPKLAASRICRAWSFLVRGSRRDHDHNRLEARIEVYDKELGACESEAGAKDTTAETARALLKKELGACE